MPRIIFVLLIFLLLLESCSYQTDTDTPHVAKNPCAVWAESWRSHWPFTFLPGSLICQDDELQESQYTLIPEYAPVSAIALSDELLITHKDKELVPQLLNQDQHVWFLSDLNRDFHNYRKYLKNQFQLDNQKLLKLSRVNIFANSAWTRDWMPVFAKNSTSSELLLLDSHYAVADDELYENAAPAQLKHELIKKGLMNQNIKVKKWSWEATLDGGNLLCNSQLCFTTEKFVHDNKGKHLQFKSIFEQQFAQKLLIVPVLPFESTGHIDIWAKFLNEDLLVIAQLEPKTLALVPPNARAEYNKIQAFLERQATGKDAKGQDAPNSLAYKFRKYNARGQIKRIPLPLPLAIDGNMVFRTYLNAILANQKVFVPQYKQTFTSDGSFSAYPDQALNAAYESSVLKLYKQAGYTVTWHQSDRLIQAGGALHCVATQIPLL
jgi:agmatine/peptidylarginine deiminase